jgi:hypothetical protein
MGCSANVDDAEVLAISLLYDSTLSGFAADFVVVFWLIGFAWAAECMC